jgi:anti-sigma regulatory factor (Ser/Thr protein kinase)
MRDIITITIPNRIGCFKWLYPVSEGILRELPFDDKERHLIMVSISEGFTNAFQHGNQEDPEARIKLNFCITEKSLKILIEDDGLLPIKKNINHVYENAEQYSDSGRGLDLMRNIADEVSYDYDSKGINRLTLTYNFKADGSKISNLSGS